MNVCLIPARKNSTRFPGKNKIRFHGKPIIRYAIDCAKHAKIFDKIIVATDDPDIGEITYDAGVDLLPRYKSVDSHSTDDDVIEECWPELKYYNTLCRLYPITPLLNPKSIYQAYSMLYRFDSVIALAEYEHPPQRALYLENGRVKEADDEGYNTRTQDLKPMYYDPGAFQVFYTKAWHGSLSIPNMGAVILEWHEYQDIDYPNDLRKLEAKWRAGWR